MTGPVRATSRPLALVTGASRGLGLTLARFLSGAGYDLILTARGQRDLECAASGLPGPGLARTLAGSVTAPEHRASLAAAVGRRLDLLIHNASSLGPSPLPDLEAAELPAVRSVFETNVVAPLALTQALLDPLRAAGGTLVAVTSDAALGGYPGWGVYGASKAALELMARTFAAELPDVAVVCVDPGDMRTAMHQAAFPGEDIGDRPLPDATLPFWAWLLGQRRDEVSGRRFEAQADAWTLPDRQSPA